MINRRCKADDDRGVGEPLDENQAIKLNHYLIFENFDPSHGNKRNEFEGI